MRTAIERYEQYMMHAARATPIAQYNFVNCLIDDSSLHNTTGSAEDIYVRVGTMCRSGKSCIDDVQLSRRQHSYIKHAWKELVQIGADRLTEALANGKEIRTKCGPNKSDLLDNINKIMAIPENRNEITNVIGQALNEGALDNFQWMNILQNLVNRELKAKYPAIFDSFSRLFTRYQIRLASIACSSLERQRV